MWVKRTFKCNLSRKWYFRNYERLLILYALKDTVYLELTGNLQTYGCRLQMNSTGRVCVKMSAIVYALPSRVWKNANKSLNQVSKDFQNTFHDSCAIVSPFESAYQYLKDAFLLEWRSICRAMEQHVYSLSYFVYVSDWHLRRNYRHTGI